MKEIRFSETQIVAILGSVGKDKTVENVCRENGILRYANFDARLIVKIS